jgi:hypothetical protein
MLAGSSPRRLAWCFLVAPALFCVSCSGASKLNPVKGKVMNKDGPIKGAVVLFHPKGADKITATPASGVTGEDGTFTLMTGQKDGVAAGEYVVTVTWPKEKAASGKIVMGPSFDSGPDQLRGAYADREKPKLTAEIHNGDNQLDPFILK